MDPDSNSVAPRWTLLSVAQEVLINAIVVPFLDIRDVAALQCVCSQLGKLAEEDGMWRSLYHRDFAAVDAAQMEVNLQLEARLKAALQIRTERLQQPLDTDDEQKEQRCQGPLPSCHFRDLYRLAQQDTLHLLDKLDSNKLLVANVLVVGLSNCGKSEYSRRLATGTFTAGATSSTIGIDYRIIRCRVADAHIKLQLWDNGRGVSLGLGYRRGAQVLLVLYDVTNQDSFRGVEDELKYLQTTEMLHKTMVVANKVDLLQCANSDFADSDTGSNSRKADLLGPGRKLANQYGVPFAFMSVATGLGCNRVMQWALRTIIRKSKEPPSRPPSPPPAQPAQRRKWCIVC